MPVYRVISTGDLALSGDATGSTGLTALGSGGTLVVIDGVQKIRQRIACRLKFFQGEWFLDLRQGMPYYRDVFVKNPNRAVIRSLYRRAILGCPGVLSLPRLDLEIDERTRRGSVAFEAICDGGRIVVKPGDNDFLLDSTITDALRRAA